MGGGHVQDEVIDADTDFDDLEEVPLYRDERGLLFFGKGLISWSATDRRGRATHRVNTFCKAGLLFSYGRGFAQNDRKSSRVRLSTEEFGLHAGKCIV